MPCVCPECCIRINDKTDNSIRCDICEKWHHLKCTKLTTDQFDIHSIEDSLEWFCRKCSADKCSTCEIILRRGKTITCSTCSNNYHISCVGLNNQTIVSVDTAYWNCFNCKNDIFPFNTITPLQIETLSFNSLDATKHSNKFRTLKFLPSAKKTNNQYLASCSVCSKKVNNTSKSIPCPNCNHFVHKKCTKLTNTEINDLKRSHNIWECLSCSATKFPLANVDEDEIHCIAFNSNCKYNPKRNADHDAKTHHQQKLVINYRSQTDSLFKSPGDEFDDLFNEFHGLEPDFKYYDNQQFHRMKEKLSNPFSIVHTNICSLQQNGENLYDLITDLEFKFDVIAVTETCNPEDKKHKFTPPIFEGYSPYLGSTGSSLKGGCGFYVNSDLKYQPRKDLNMKIKEITCEVETFWIEIINEKQPNMLICVAYRHPKKDDKQTTEKLSETLDRIKRENKKIFIVGDFNYDLLNHEYNDNISNFLNMMLENSLQPCIIEPTRIVPSCKPSLVDNIFSNSVEAVISGNLYQTVSDHMPNFVIYDKSQQPKTKKFIKRRSTKNTDIPAFQNDLLQLILYKIVNIDNFEEASDHTHKTTLHILNKHFSLEILTKKEIELESKPWITKGILTSSKIKNRTFKLFKKTGKQEDYQKFKTYRNLINKLKRRSMILYYKNYFQEHMNNAKKSWTGINTILHRNSKTRMSDIFLNSNGNLFTDQKTVSKMFNNYYINVAGNLESKIPKPKTKFQDYLRNPNEHSIYLKETTPAEVNKLTCSLDANKAPDLFGISVKIVKMGGYVMDNIISHLFNMSIDHGKFPSFLQNAKVIPCHKDDSRLEMSNYRPISLLPTISKIFEKLMYARLIEFIKKHNILYEHQFGFQSGMSTEYAVNALLNNIVNTLENKEYGVCILLDFAKAFDTVNHEILLKKLEHYGIRGVAQQWLRSYLSGRMQCTEVGDTQSELEIIRWGVPQGSVLGPLLFLIYINDIVNSSEIFKFILFADDTSLYYSCKNVKTIENIINLELNKISEWLSANRLSLNVGKSKLLYFTNNDRKKLQDINIKINDQILAEASSAKYLGVYIDNKLQWNTHISNIKLRLSKGVSILAKIRHFVPKSVLRSLYFTFVNAHIDYNLLNWGIAPLANIEMISRKTRKAIRLISFKPYDEESIPLFKLHSILPLEETFLLKQAKFMWKLQNELLPPSLTRNFNLNSRNQLTISHNRLEHSAKHITYAGPRLWSAIPADIQNKLTPKSFSNSMKNFLLANL